MQKGDDASMGNKLLRLFRLLLADGQRHYQIDLMVYLKCSRQTIIRLMREIENVIGDRLITGMNNRRRWYQIKDSTSYSINQYGIKSGTAKINERVP